MRAWTIDARRLLVSLDGEQRIALRNEIVEANMGLVELVANRLHSRYISRFGDHSTHVDYDDVRSTVVAILIDVLDSDRTGDIAAELWSRSQDAVKRLRDHQHGLGGSSRAMRRYVSFIVAEARLTNELNRTPTSAEIAEAAKTTTEEMHRAKMLFETAPFTDADAADAGAAVMAQGESSVWLRQMLDVLREAFANDPTTVVVFATRFGLDLDEPDTRPWREVVEVCGIAERDARARVERARRVIAEWIMADAA